MGSLCLSLFVVFINSSLICDTIAAFRKFVLALYGVPITPVSESLAIIELSSHSSAESASDSGIWGLDDRVGKRKRAHLPDATSSGISTASSSIAVKTAGTKVNKGHLQLTKCYFLVTYLVPR